MELLNGSLLFSDLSSSSRVLETDVPTCCEAVDGMEALSLFLLDLGEAGFVSSRHRLEIGMRSSRIGMFVTLATLASMASRDGLTKGLLLES